MTMIEGTRENFHELVADGLVLVDMWGPSCATCLALMPDVERLSAEHDLPVVKLEAPKARRLCMELKVLGLPAFLMFRDGDEVARLAGPDVTAAQLASWVEESMSANREKKEVE